jgi:hypothetical protein
VFLRDRKARPDTIIPLHMNTSALLLAVALILPVASLHGSAWAAEPVKPGTQIVSPESPGATVTDDAQRVAAAVLADAMNARPSSSGRAADALRVLENDVTQMLRLNREQELELIDFSDHLDTASALPWEEVVYVLLALVLALTAVVQFRVGIGQSAPQLRAFVPALNPVRALAEGPSRAPPEMDSTIARVTQELSVATLDNLPGPHWASQDEAVREEIRKTQERVARGRAERHAAASRLKRESEYVASAPVPLPAPIPVPVPPPVPTPVPVPPPVPVPVPVPRPVPTPVPVPPPAPIPVPVPVPPPPQSRIASAVSPQSLQLSSKVNMLVVAFQQVDAYMAQNNSISAIRVLSDHILGRTEAAPMAYLQLLDIYSRLGLQEEYESLSTVFLCVFEHVAPEMAVTGLQNSPPPTDTLLSHAQLLECLISEWPQARQSLVLIEDLLFRHPDNEHTLLSLPAYRELLWLYEVQLTAALLDSERSAIAVRKLPH